MRGIAATAFPFTGALLLSSFIFILSSTPVLALNSPVTGLNLISAGLKLASYSSLNWGGYFVNKSTFTYASAEWTVPAVSSTVSGDSAVWVGIGGVLGNGYLIQTGTEQDCGSGAVSGVKYHGLADQVASGQYPTGSSDGHTFIVAKRLGKCTPSYYAWWETWPANAEQKISTISVSPGNKMEAYIKETGTDNWTITITDLNNSETFSKTVSFAPNTGTAEAITERPEICSRTCSLTKLADFGTVKFSDAAAGSSTNYFNLLHNNSVTMVDSRGAVLASPSALSTDGVFSMTWERSS